MSDLEKALEQDLAFADDEVIATVVDAARRFANLTSPETIEKAANELFKRDDLNDIMKPWHLETALAVLRLVEEEGR